MGPSDSMVGVTSLASSFVHVVLVAPEIAPNTGNIIRLAANTGVALHLVEPIGFSLDDRLLRRGGLDYHEFADVRLHQSVEDLFEFLDARAADGEQGRRYAFSSSGTRRYTEVSFRSDDVVLFGAERAGLSAESLGRVPADHVLQLPMQPGSRSLNLANAVAVVVYEAWRQQGFLGAVGGSTGEQPSSVPFDS